jgi:ectoine hydroxylase-related dioxygenase (phytanoyl-CoA dioxygenase family)
MTRCRVRGAEIPESLLGPMPDSAGLLGDPDRLRARLEADGFLYLRSVLDPDSVLAARREILARLETVDEVVPGSDGIFTGRSRRAEREPDLGAFWKSVSEGPRLRAVSHGPSIACIVTAVAGEPVVAQDYVFLRVGVAGRATGLHYDYPFFARAHDRVWTVWLPLGDVPMERGPLVMVEGSHRFRDLVEPMIGFDVTKDPSRKADLGSDAASFARQRGTRLLTADFQPGDVAVFGMYVAHGSLDHHEASGRVRISCDVRWQPARLPRDERYFGADPGGTTGAGYAELNGAKPLDQPWHVR